MYAVIETGGKTPVFGLLKRGGKGYTKVIADASSATLYPIIERKVVPDSIVYSDCWRGYDVLDVSDFRHFRLNPSRRFAERQMRKFNGVPRSHFPLFLKACEWHFNNPNPQEQ